MEIWISAKRSDGGQRNEFYWTYSGELVTYTNWEPNEPRRWINRSNCVRLKKETRYKWSEHKCLDNQLTALCKW